MSPPPHRAESDRSRSPQLEVRPVRTHIHRLPHWDWGIGTRFVITGPNPCGGWKPRFWTGFPGSPGSRRVKADEQWIDVQQTFTVEELQRQRRYPFFVTARVRVDDKYLWINIAKNHDMWAQEI